MDKTPQGFSTRCIHAGQAPDPSTGAIMPPISQSSTYVQDSPGVHKGLDYGRSHNPTRWALERCVADLEGGAQGYAFASGLAAISTVLELLDAGSHIVSSGSIYGGSHNLFTHTLPRFGITTTFVDPRDPAAFSAAIRSITRTSSRPAISRSTRLPATNSNGRQAKLAAASKGGRGRPAGKK